MQRQIGSSRSVNNFISPQDLLGGVIVGFLSAVFGLSYAALIFSGTLSSWLPLGLSVTFVSLALAAFIFSLRCSIPFMIAGPDDSTAVTAALAAALSDRLVAIHYPGSYFEAVQIVIALSSGLTGLALCLLGVAKAGRAIRFVPYPVIGGFLAATSWLLVTGAFRVVTGERLEISELLDLSALATLEQLLAALAVGVTVFAIRRRWPNALVFPSVLTIAVLIFYAVAMAAGLSMRDIPLSGWTFGPQTKAGFPALTTEAVVAFPWRELPALTGEILAIVFVTVVGMLLNSTGVELATRREANLDRDLTTLGLANLAVAALGGYVSSVSVSRSTLNYSIGARNRVSGIVAAATALCMVFIDPVVLGYVPRFVVGGLLVYIGLDLAHRWLVQSVSRLPLSEYLSLLAIALIIVNVGFIAGVLIGIVIGCAMFAVSVSRVNAIKFSFDGAEFRSSLDRGADELSTLSQHGHKIQGLCLQSYLFFGSANRLLRRVQERLAKSKCHFLVFDLRLVNGIDSSAIQSFLQIRQAAERAEAHIILVGASPELLDLLTASHFLDDSVHVEPELDRALELCENSIIDLYQVDVEAGESLKNWFKQILGHEDSADVLVRACERRTYQAGEVISRQGDQSQSMYFVADGRVGIILEGDAAGRVRLRSLGRRTTVGEMGLITRQPRTATIEAELDTELFELKASTFDRLKKEHPELIQSLLTYLISILAERLGYASRTIGVLKRS